MARHRIAMIAACQFPSNYGSPAAIRELTETLSKRAHEVHVITYPEGEDLSVGTAQLHRVGRQKVLKTARVGPALIKLWWDLLMIIETVRVIRRHGCEIIHAHNYEGCLIGIAAKLLTGRPMIYNAVNLMSDELHTYHVMPEFIAKLLARALDWFVPIFPDHIIALTPELRLGFIRQGVAEDRVTFVSAGVTPALLDGVDPVAVEKFRVQYGIRDRPVVMYTGVNNEFQRVDYLLRAFTVVRESVPGALLVILSPLDDEPNRPINEALARELGIEADTRFIGPHALADLKNFLSLASVCVVSRPDCPGQPIKLLNYMTMSKPSVCFAGGAKGVRHLHDVLIAPDRDWQAMGGEIVTLLSDPPLRERIGANARQTVLRDFDWGSLCAKIEVIYDRMTTPGASRAQTAAV